ncbi:MAG TPA: hypothetical protein VMW45_04520 [Dehalococcoidia bacterium]|nr:hypothetical protein [Dehalococcoidia bacterium]
MTIEKKDPERIPTRQETVDKCFAAFDELTDLVGKAREAFCCGLNDSAKSYLQDAEKTIDAIRMFIGGCK